MIKKMANKELNEDLNRFKTLLGYDPAKGNEINERLKPNREAYYLTEEEPEEDTEEGGDFDFGDEGNPEEEGGFGGEESKGGDFDFGDEGSPEEEGEEEIEDEFGTASEFSAADELEVEDEDVEEIDVTAIVNSSDEAKEMAQQAVTVGQENSSYLQSLTDKLSNLEAQLSKMDTIASKIGKLEQDIKTPEERLELRSLDSYPFNQKLSDYWEEKAKTDDRYRISTGENFEDGQQKEYVLNPKDVEDDYNEEEIKNSFNPEK
jgi:Skp family chaperone for outer membrane proteins